MKDDRKRNWSANFWIVIAGSLIIVLGAIMTVPFNPLASKEPSCQKRNASADCIKYDGGSPTSQLGQLIFVGGWIVLFAGFSIPDIERKRSLHTKNESYQDFIR